jgi:Rod binding domain-containing protein
MNLFMSAVNNIGKALPKEAMDLPIEKLPQLKTLDEKQKVAVASRHFETMFLRMMLSETQKPVVKSKYSYNSARDEIYRDFMVSNLAEALSKSEPLKISSLIQSQIIKSNSNKQETGNISI